MINSLEILQLKNTFMNYPSPDRSVHGTQLFQFKELHN